MVETAKVCLTSSLLISALSCNRPSLPDWEFSGTQSLEKSFYDQFEGTLKDIARQDSLTIDFSNEYIKTVILKLAKKYSKEYNEIFEVQKKNDPNYILTISAGIWFPDLLEAREKILGLHQEDMNYKFLLWNAVVHDTDSSVIRYIDEARTKNPSAYPDPDSIKGRDGKIFQQQLDLLDSVQYRGLPIKYLTTKPQTSQKRGQQQYSN